MDLHGRRLRQRATRYARPRAEDVSRLMSTSESITDLTSTLYDTLSRAVDGELDQAEVPGLVETIDFQVRSIVDELEGRLESLEWQVAQEQMRSQPRTNVPASRPPRRRWWQ